MTDAIEKAIKTIEHYAYLHWMKEGMGSGSGRTYALIPDSFKDMGEDAIQLLREHQSKQPSEGVLEENKRLRAALLEISKYEYNQGLYYEIAQQALQGAGR